MSISRWFSVAVGLLPAIAFSGCNGDHPLPTGSEPLTTPPPSAAPGPGVTPTPTSPAVAGTSLGVLWSPDSEPVVLPVPDDALELAPTDINDAGEVAGMIIDRNGLSHEAFVWSASKGLRRSGLLSTIYGGLVVSSISSTGVVVGYVVGFVGNAAEGFAWSADAGIITPPSKRFLPMSINGTASMVGVYEMSPTKWTAGGGFEQLPNGSDECAGTIDINDSEEILGWGGKEGQMGCDETTGIVWRRGEKPTEFKRCKGDRCFIDVVAINSLGHVAGTEGDTAFRVSTRPGESLIQELPNASARDLNDSDDMLGNVGSKPFVWAANGQVRMLAIPAGFASAWASAINNRGEVVGSISTRSW